MSFRGRQWLRRIEWRLAIEYGRAYGDHDFIWTRGIEGAWEIIQALMTTGSSPVTSHESRVTQKGGCL